MKLNWKVWRENVDLANLDAKYYGFFLAFIVLAYNLLRVVFLFAGVGPSRHHHLDLRDLHLQALSADERPTVVRHDLRCYQLYENLSRLHLSVGSNHPPARLAAKDLFDEKDEDGGDIYLRSMWIVDTDYRWLKENPGASLNVNDSQILETKQNILAKKSYNVHEDVYLESMLKKYLIAFELYQVRAAVLGFYKRDWTPWIESLLLFVGVEDVTTIDYARKEYETSGLKWTHLNQYLQDKLGKHSIYKMVSSFLNAPYTFDGEFDVVVSHLSIETIGLGRYGERLQPSADIDSIEQVYCMLKSGGRFFLTVSASRDESSHIEYNTRRVYGERRLQTALGRQQWIVEEALTYNFGAEKLFVLQKP